MKKKIVLVFIFALLTVFLAFAAYKVMNKDQDYYTKSDFVLDSNNKYIITTNMKWMTMQNDGGSNTNTYYQIDFNKNKIIKCVDKYVGFEGYEYKGKILYSKEISKKEKQDLKSIINNIINNNVEQPEKLNYDYYVLSSFNNEDVKIYDKDIIGKLNIILEK